MNSDGSSVQQMTDGGYASRPPGRPTDSFLLCLGRKYGPERPATGHLRHGGRHQEMDQLTTTEAAATSLLVPDNRHIVYATSQ